MGHRPHELGVEQTAPVFAALGDPTRLQVVARLSREGPLSITRLSAGTEITRQAVTKHLQVLAGAGLVRDRRSGRERLWEVAPEQIEAARRWLARVSERWDASLARLRAFVEE